MTGQRVFVLMAVLFITAATIVAQNAPPPPPPPVPRRITATGSTYPPTAVKTPGATIRGRVVYADTGAPIRYAMVGFTVANRFGSTSEFVRTDENGAFLYKDLAPGEYYPVVKNRGILNPEAFGRSVYSSEESRRRIESVFPKISVNGSGEFQVFIRARRGATITGMIRYFDGEPAVGVRVEALPISDGTASSMRVRSRNSPNSVETDDRGVYRFSGLPQGSYRVRVTEPVSHRDTKSGGNYGAGTNPFLKNPFQTYFPGTPNEGEADSFEVYYGQTAEGVNINLPQRNLYDISGIVVRKDNRQPLTNFKIDFALLEDEVESGGDGDSKSDVAKRLISLSSGFGSSTNYGNELEPEWSLRNLPNGKYRLTATQMNQYLDPSDKNPQPETIRYPKSFKDIEIIDGDLLNVVIEVPAGGSLKGAVETSDNEELNSYIFLSAMNKETGETARSNFNRPEKTTGQPGAKRRQFDFGKLREGSYKIVFSGRRYYIDSVFVGDKRVADNTIEIEDGKDLTNIRVILASDVATLKGTISEHDPGVQTSVFLLRTGQDVLTSLGSNGSSARVKPDGTFEVKAAPGEYSVLVIRRDEVPSDPVGLVGWIEKQRADAEIITLAAKQIKTISVSQ